jgi:hypothetical protein
VVQRRRWCTEGQRCRTSAEVGAEVQRRSRHKGGAEVLKRYSGRWCSGLVLLQRCRGPEVQRACRMQIRRCRGGAEVQ